MKRGGIPRPVNARTLTALHQRPRVARPRLHGRPEGGTRKETARTAAAARGWGPLPKEAHGVRGGPARGVGVGLKRDLGEGCTTLDTCSQGQRGCALTGGGFSRTDTPISAKASSRPLMLIQDPAPRLALPRVCDAHGKSPVQRARGPGQGTRPAGLRQLLRKPLRGLFRGLLRGRLRSRRWKRKPRDQAASRARSRRPERRP